MVELKFDLDERRSVMERVMAMAPRIVLALFFIVIGWTKFASPMWDDIFRRIGFGKWFQYLAGAMQLGGGLLLLVPRTAMVGAALIACTMVGAVLTDLFVVHGGPIAVVPVVLFAFAVGVGLQVWSHRA